MQSYQQEDQRNNVYFNSSLHDQIIYKIIEFCVEYGIDKKSYLKQFPTTYQNMLQRHIEYNLNPNEYLKKKIPENIQFVIESTKVERSVQFCSDLKD